MSCDAMLCDGMQNDVMLWWLQRSKSLFNQHEVDGIFNIYEKLLELTGDADLGSKVHSPSTTPTHAETGSMISKPVLMQRVTATSFYTTADQDLCGESSVCGYGWQVGIISLYNEQVSKLRDRFKKVCSGHRPLLPGVLG